MTFTSALLIVGSEVEMAEFERCVQKNRLRRHRVMIESGFYLTFEFDIRHLSFLKNTAWRALTQEK